VLGEQDHRLPERSKGAEPPRRLAQLALGYFNTREGQIGNPLLRGFPFGHDPWKRYHGNHPIFASTNHSAKNPPIMATTQRDCLVRTLSFIPPLPVMEEWGRDLRQAAC
jgi:hypothetical protein